MKSRNDDCPSRLVLEVHPSAFSTNITATEESFSALAGCEDLVEVVLVMRNTYRLDSRALRALVDLHRTLDERGGRLVLTEVPEALKRLLEYVRLDRTLCIDGSGRGWTAAGAAAERSSFAQVPGTHAGAGMEAPVASQADCSP